MTRKYWSMKMKALIKKTVVRVMLPYGFETWPISARNKKSISTTEMRMVRWATFGPNSLEHSRNYHLGGSKVGGTDCDAVRS